MSFEKNKRPLLGEHKKSTTELLSSINAMAKNKSDDEFTYFMQTNQDEFSYNPQVGKYLRDTLGARLKEINIPELADMTGISKSYLYQIIPIKDKPPKTTKNNPDRRMLIAIAIYLHLSVDETQHLLKYAKEPELYPRNTFDSVILYALESNCNLVTTNILLAENNCQMLDWHKE